MEVCKSVGFTPVRKLNSKEVLRKVLPLTGILGISRITETNSYVDLGVSIVSATRTDIRFEQVSSTQGKGFKLGHAITGAVVESLERYCAANISGLLLSSGIDKLDPEGNPLDLAFGYGDKFYPSKWIRGVDLRRGQETWMPALEVLFPYNSSDFEPPRVRPHTSGLAAGADLTEASLFAMLEVYERNVTSLFYRRVRAKNNGSVIDTTTVTDDKASILLRDLCSRGYELIVFRLHAIFPTYYAAVLDVFSLAPKFMIAGTSTALSDSDALSGALLECVQGLVTSVAGSREDLVRSSVKYKNQILSKNNIFYEIKELLIKQNGISSFPQYESKLINCDLAWLKTFSVLEKIVTGPILMCDLTHRDLPLNVVKVVVPSLNDWMVNPRRGR